jgi:energy-coupling factor transporter ATP-binding protein EcfA2
LKWLDEPHERPLVVLGGYGSGKTTFASHLTGLLATRAMSDPTQRIPVRIRLGDLTEQNNLEGLFGAHFTAAHNARGYSWQLFQELNRLGRFLIVFDGFDEMKHGMTLPVFQRQFNLLLSLAVGDAKVLILGRDTAFKDDTEFKAVIKGKRRTVNGNEVSYASRPECDHVKLEPFTIEEAHRFIRGYFSLLARTEVADAQPEWVEGRLLELLSPHFAELVVRPVHSQMLCRIATKPNWGLSEVDLFSLYDRFIEYLLMREVDKPGRFAGFDVGVRRAANASLSWWLFSEEGASTTSVSAAPLSLFKAAVGNVDHEFDNEALVRELAQGCLVEKGSDIVYFGHRSIQEFLASEHLYQSCLSPDGEKSGAVASVCRWATDQVCEFLDEFFVRREDGKATATFGVDQFLNYPGSLDLDRLTPYAIALRHSDYPSDDLPGPNGVWLSWLSRHKIDGAFYEAGAFDGLISIVRTAQAPMEYLAALHLLMSVFIANYRETTPVHRAEMVAAMVNPKELSEVVGNALSRRTFSVHSSRDLRSYILTKATSLSKSPVSGNLQVELDVAEVNDVTKKLLGFLPTRSSTVDVLSAGTPILTAEVQEIMRRLRSFPGGETALGQGRGDNVRQFFDANVRARIGAVEIATASRHAGAAPRRPRPTVGSPSKGR